MVFSDAFFAIAKTVLHFGKAASWKSSESSRQKLVPLFTIHQLGIFSSGALSHLFVRQLFWKLNK